MWKARNKNMATLTLNNVKKSFGKTDVIHGVSIDIEDGEFISIVATGAFTPDVRALE